MFCTVEVSATFEVADEAEAQAIVKAGRALAVRLGLHDADEVAENIVSVRDALHHLMTNAALELPIKSAGVTVYADEVAATPRP